MNSLEIIISGLLLGLFIAISVGPNLFAIIRYSMYHTYKAGLFFVFGVLISDFMYVILANIAMIWFLEYHHMTISVIGSLLFIVMGLFLFFKQYTSQPDQFNNSSLVTTSTYLKIWLSGFLMNTLNPAVLILWMWSVVKVAIYSLNEKILFYGICLIVVFTLDIGKVFLSEKIRSWLTVKKIIYLNKISAALIFSFGVILLVTTLLWNPIIL